MSNTDDQPVPPPPPFPAQTKQPQNDNKSEDSNNTSDPFSSLEGAIWANREPELKTACLRNSIFISKQPGVWRYNHFDSILQVGPTCGLVALSMLIDQRLSPDELLELAISHGYTNNGEMFSVKYMYKLCRLVKKELNLGDFEFDIEHCNQGDLIDKYYINALIDGCKFLVPYDTDRNHSPCLNKGHSAHWALISGVLIDGSMNDYDIDDVYVAAKHGKSKYLAVWKLKELCYSNLNLVEMSPKRVVDHLEYVMPEGGLNGPNGLCGQFILIRD